MKGYTTSSSSTYGFTNPVTYLTSRKPYSSPARSPIEPLNLGDFNGDGKDDMAILYDYGSSTTGLWKFTSDGTG